MVAGFLNLKDRVTSFAPIVADDAVRTKTALQRLGYYKPPSFGINQFMDDAMLRGLKRFQTENGLEADGEARPGGPTERLINASLREREKPTPSPFGLDGPVGTGAVNDPWDVKRVKWALSNTGYYPPHKPLTGEARDDVDFERGLSNLQRDFNLRRDRVMNPGGPTANILDRLVKSEASPRAMLTDAGLGAQKLPKIDRPGESIKPKILPRRKGDEVRPIELAQTQSDTGSKQKPPKKQVATYDELSEFEKSRLHKDLGKKHFEDWRKALSDRDDIGPNERRAYMATFASEGGAQQDRTSSAFAGILADTLKELRDLNALNGSGISPDLGPADLTAAQRLAVYRAYANKQSILGRVEGKASAIEAISDEKAAMAMFDTLFTFGGVGASKLMQRAINRVVPGKVAEEPGMGQETFDAYRDLAENVGTRRQMLRELTNQRNIERPKEKARNEFFGPD